MRTEKIEGLVAAPLTAFDERGSVHFDEIAAVASFLHRNGVAGAFVNGTTGEGLSLTVQERMSIAQRWVEAAPKGFKVIVHVAHTSHRETGHLAAHAQRIGAWGIGEMGPCFYRPGSVEELVAYAAVTADKAPDLPYYYYHMPAMNNVRFAMLDFLRIAEGVIPTLAGIKYTDEDLMDFELCREYGDGKYDILHGRDETLLCALALGARGAVGSTYNFMAPLYIRLMTAFDEGNVQEARRLQRLSIAVIRRLAATGCYFSAAKVVMRMLGFEFGGVRPPLVDISESDADELEKDLSDLGFFRVCSKAGYEGRKTEVRFYETSTGEEDEAQG